jgi:tetratricopeptide (TPR) repeat protein
VGEASGVRQSHEELMNAIHDVRAIIHVGLGQAKDGRLEEARATLETALSRAQELGDTRLIVLAARNAAVVSEHAHDYDGARRFYETVLQHDNGDGYAYVALARADYHLGRQDAARQHLSAAEALANQTQDQRLIEIVAEARRRQ